MNTLSLEAFESLPENEKLKELYRINVINNEKVEKHELMYMRFIKYEKLMGRAFIGMLLTLLTAAGSLVYEIIKVHIK